MFNGYISAVVSPFNNGEIDTEGFSKYINWLIESGINGIVVSGTTGESAALSLNEKVQLIEASKKIIKKRVPLIVGVGSPNTSTTLSQVELINSIDGVDAIMVVTPFYVKPSQSGICEHFREISKISHYPIVIYNNPGRAAIDIGTDTIIDIAKLDNVVALKEASTDVSRFCTLRKALGKGFSLLSGNDDTAPAAWAMGADGAVSVSANIIPSACSEMYKAFKELDFEKFSQLRNDYFSIHKLMFREPSPAPLKYALSLKGFIKEDVRLPLLPLTENTKRIIHDELLKLKEI